MKLSLTARLTLAFLVIVLTMALLVGVFVRRANVRQVTQLISRREKETTKRELEDYYRDHGSWAGVADYIRAIHPLQPGPPTEGGGARPPLGQPLFGVADGNGVIVVPLPPAFTLGARVPQPLLREGIALRVDNRRVGTLLPLDVTPGLTAEEAEFLRIANNALLIGILGAVAVAGLAAFLLTRTLTRPLRELTAVSATIAKGNFGQQVPVRSQDEVGNLAAAFNQMSHDLAEANRLRRQLTADIAHDLRTPLTVLGGYIESMREGLLKPTPERLDLMYAEVGNMERLVADLRTLSRADAGELTADLQPHDLGELVERVVKTYQHQATQKEVRLITSLPATLPLVPLDAEQMARVLGNLVSNGLRHTPAQGEIEVGITAVSHQVQLQVRDDGDGIAPEHLPYIFHRFYRADPSRQSEHGESGLGLAIVKSIVEAHGGRVSANSAGLGQGTTFTILLPLAHPL